MTGSTVRLPGYPLPRILKLRDKIYDRLLPRYAHLSLAGGDVMLLAEELTAQLPPSVPLPVLLDTARQLLDIPLTPEFLREFSWRVAGNLLRLKQGIPAIPWRAPGVEEWVPVQVLRVDPAPDKAGKGGRYTLQLRVLAGSACPRILFKTFGKESLQVASRHFGFSRRRGKYPYQSPYLLVNLRFYIWLEPKLSRGDEPGFFEIRCPASCLEFNAELLRLRFRADGRVCPENFSHDCHRCVVGYLRCPAATHRMDLVERMCTACGKLGWFDPEASLEKCIVCHRRMLTHGK